jgi:hypothetical protein
MVDECNQVAASEGLSGSRFSENPAYVSRFNSNKASESGKSVVSYGHAL